MSIATESRTCTPRSLTSPLVAILVAAIRRGRTVLIAAVLAGVAVLMIASPSSAAKISSYSGTPGAVSLNGAMITGFDNRLGAPSYATYALYQTAGVTAGRSAASSQAQYVYTSYMLQTSNDGVNWVNSAQSPTYGATVSGSGRYAFPVWQTNTPSQNSFKAYYRFTTTVIWYEASTGRLLAWETIAPSTAGDARCSNRYLSCVPYTNAILM